MSGTLTAPNPLQQQPPMPQGANPLQASAPPQSSPMAQKPPPTVNDAAHQMIMANLDPDQRQQVIHYLTYTTAELGKLAGKKNVTSKDVVKATADAIGAGVIKADQGVQFLGTIPDKPEMLRPWLSDLYHEFMVASVAAHAVDTVHQHAALAQQAAQGVPVAVAVQPGAVAPSDGVTPPGAPTGPAGGASG